MTTTGWVELLILVGNGAGLGAMKISRGMFETAVMAKYLRQGSEEIADYTDYGRILQLKLIKVSPGIVPPEKAAEIEREYNRVKPRFQDEKGRIRSQWSKHPISYMAEKIGRKQQYELPYSLAASIHHGNFEAWAAHLSGDRSALDVDSLPSWEWIQQALVSGHVYLLQALDTLNDLLKLGFDERLHFGPDFSRPKFGKRGALDASSRTVLNLRKMSCFEPCAQTAPGIKVTTAKGLPAGRPPSRKRTEICKEDFYVVHPKCL